jgi:osmoprotectant transport system substrate-binding protein
VAARRTGGRPARIIATALAVLTVAAACTGERGSAPRPSARPAAVSVASFNFPESELLAEIYAQALEAAGIPVRRELGLGTRELVQPALRQHLVDVVPEYLGTALASIDPHARLDWHDPDAVLDALRRALAPWGFVPLRPAAASDQNGFAVTRATRQRLGIRSLSDLAAVRPPLVLGGPSECPVRPYCLAGLRRVYGMTIKRFVPFDDQAQRESALEEGVVDVAVTFTTNGTLASGRVVLLRDDRALQPTERVVPVVSQRAISRHGPLLQDVLDAVSARLDTAGLRFLNWRIGRAEEDIAAEAHGWLHRHGLLGGR